MFQAWTSIGDISNWHTSGQKPCLSNLLPQVSHVAYLISMVFKLCYPKSPGIDMPPGMKTMLRTCAATPWVVGSVFPKLGFAQKGGLPGRLEWPLRSLGIVLPVGIKMASYLLSMVSALRTR